MSVVIYALLWISFGYAHSVFTQPGVKQRLTPFLGSAYRITYNLISTLHVGAVLLLGRQILNMQAWVSNLAVSFALNAMMVLGALLMIASLRQYDLGSFSGLTQLRNGEQDSAEITPEPLNTSGLNSWVRHPLYSGALLFLWGNATSEFGVWTAVFASAYFIIGARYEERKLVRVYGQAYCQYQDRVPAFVPWRKKLNYH